MPYLLGLEKKTSASREEAFPFNVPSLANTPRVQFSSPVTFFVGENGSGKSTLLESIAAGVNAITVGGTDIQHDETLKHARELASSFRFSWKRRTGRGFFMRAEDFFNFSRRILQTTRELDELIDGYRAELEERPGDEGLLRAIGFMNGQKMAMTSRYGENLDANSHGESFMKVFQSRLVPNGLYLLDEPEAALSPLRQLTLLALMKQSVKDGCQFIIATHSPILMAFPEAEILCFDDGQIARGEYDELQHVQITRSFLRDPQAFIHRL